MIKAVSNFFGLFRQPKSIIISGNKSRQLRALPDKLIWPDDSPLTVETLVVQFSSSVDYKKVVKAIGDSVMKEPDAPSSFKVVKMDKKITIE